MRDHAPTDTVPDPTRDLHAAARAVNRDIPGADETLYRLTGCPSVLGLLRHMVEHPRFTPVYNVIEGRWPQADIFDAAMAGIGDPRRAERLL